MTIKNNYVNYAQSRRTAKLIHSAEAVCVPLPRSGLLFLLVRFPFLSVLHFSKAIFIYIVRSLRFILSPESVFYT